MTKLVCDGCGRDLSSAPRPFKFSPFVVSPVLKEKRVLNVMTEVGNAQGDYCDDCAEAIEQMIENISDRIKTPMGVRTMLSDY